MSAKADRTVPPLTRALARMTGARLCFGRPVQTADRTVIPVASVRTAGGGGFGAGASPAESGGGGGGMLDARPVGFIEISAAGTRFERIDDGRTALRAIGVGTLALLVLSRTFRRRRSRSQLRQGARRLALPRRGARRTPGGRRRGLLPGGGHSSQGS